MKNRFIKVISLFTLAFLLTSSTVICSAEETSTAVVQTGASEELNSDYAKAVVRMAMSIVKGNYKYDISDSELYKNALFTILEEHPEVWESAFRGIYDNLDEHSTYFTKEEYDSFTSDISGEICGIGVSILEFSDGLLITQIFSNSPAAEGGLEVGDIIISADGTDIRGMDINIARTYITGEEGTQVKIGYMRNDVYMESVLTRRQVVVDSGRYYTVNDKIGYIQLYSFDEHASDFITTALTDFDKKGITNIIFDLRNNPGGNLFTLKEICEKFIPAGPIIHIEYKNPLRNYQLNSENTNPKYKLIVLSNENSASAAEAFAGAVQDTGVGIVLGSQSYGKGTMQNLTKFKIGGGIKLTEAEYLTPNKRNINGIGIEPDLKIKDKEIPYNTAKLSPITYERIIKLGDSGEDVKAIKQRLDMLGYTIDISTDVFDEGTMYATKKFQENCNLFPYGEMDLSTQLELENMFIGKNVSDNATFNKAVEIFESGTIDEYKHTWSPDDYKTRIPAPKIGK